MSTTIESLELEIQSKSEKAVAGIDALTLSLGKLQNVTAGKLGLSAVVNEIASFNKAYVAGVKSKSKILADAISSLANLPKSNLSGYIAPLTNLPKAFAGLESIDTREFTAGLSELVTALYPLETLSKTNLPGYITSLKKIPDVMKGLNDVDMGAFGAKMQEVATAMKPLADEMEKVSNGFSAMPTKIQKLLKETNKIPSANKKATGSFTDLYNRVKSVVNIIGTVVGKVKSYIKQSSEYTENVHLFNVAMGEYAEGAMSYAETIREAMGIDPNEWIRSQGVFMTLATGFGVASDRASTMSQNLTQLGYDLASFYNMDVEEAMQKLQSGLAGELEPLRRIGYDLSQAKLEATALALGIDKSVSSMTQAEKAQLRYYAIMTQVTETHGDMAETITSPANQLRILKSEFAMATREIGNAFIPALNAVLPIAIAVTRVIGTLANVVAGLFGYEAPEIESATSAMVENTDAMTENLAESQEEAKKLKSYMLGFDELNVINPNTDSAEAPGTQFDFDLPTYEFLGEETENKIAVIVEDMKEWLGITEEIKTWSDLFDTKLGTILETVGLIGGALLLWKLSTSFTENLATLTTSLGMVLLIKNVVATFEEGLSWESVLGAALGASLAGAGIGFKLGGIPGAIGGIIIGIGVSLLINGITSMIGEGVNVENVIATISGVLGTVGGIVTVVKLFNKNTKNPVKEFETAGKTIGEVSTGTSTLTTKLASIAKNLGLGIAIIAEVAIAAGLIVGAIWGLGVLLDQVGKAWQPVIDNGATVATAIGIGTGLLVAVGVATGLLGTLGGTMVGQIAIGTAILLELGVAAALFIAEIWLIGKGLDEIGKAWQPVIDNGETIATGIGIGTGLLLAIGVVTALLGVATVASAGLLPLAIGLGTLMLLELAGAFVLFTESLVTVAKELSENLHPALENLCLILPDLTTNMSEFTTFMGGFAGEVVKYSLSSSISGIAATVDTIIGFFTTDPVKKMAKDVEKQGSQFDKLIDKLTDTIPKIQKAIELQKKYNKAMSEFGEVQSGGSGGVLGAIGDFFGGIGDAIGSLFGARSIDTGASVSVAAIPTFASGGFPEQGQMFIAREAGAEMVGNIGRRTAVANNDQIVASISGGVAEANEEQNALLREQNSLLRALLEKDSGVYLDGRQLTNSVEKYQRDRGRNIVVGGVL